MELILTRFFEGSNEVAYLWELSNHFSGLSDSRIIIIYSTIEIKYFDDILCQRSN